MHFRVEFLFFEGFEEVFVGWGLARVKEEDDDEDKEGQRDAGGYDDYKRN